MANRSRGGAIPQREGAYDSALGATTEGERLRAHRHAAPLLALLASGSGLNRNPEETCAKLAAAVRARKRKEHMKRARLQQGSVVFDKRRRTWNFLWCENGHRRTKLIGSARDFPTKTSAWRAAEPFRRLVENPVSNPGVTVNGIVAQYRNEKMPRRLSTRRGYEAWLNNHILPRWRNCPLTDLQARPVE